MSKHFYVIYITLLVFTILLSLCLDTFALSGVACTGKTTLLKALDGSCFNGTVCTSRFVDFSEICREQPIFANKFGNTYMELAYTMLHHIRSFADHIETANLRENAVIGGVPTDRVLPVNGPTMCPSLTPNGSLQSAVIRNHRFDCGDAVPELLDSPPGNQPTNAQKSILDWFVLTDRCPFDNLIYDILFTFNGHHDYANLEAKLTAFDTNCHESLSQEELLKLRSVDFAIECIANEFVRSIPNYHILIVTVNNSFFVSDNMLKRGQLDSSFNVLDYTRSQNLLFKRLAEKLPRELCSSIKVDYLLQSEDIFVFFREIQSYYNEFYKNVLANNHELQKH